MNKIILHCRWLLVLLMVSCQWEEEPGLAELYAGSYTGVMDIYPAAGGEGQQLENKDVVMTVAGDHRLNLHIKGIPIAGAAIDSFALPAELSGDGLNRITGKLEDILLESGVRAYADMEGTVAYGKSDLVIYITVGIEQNEGESVWVVKFSGKRR